MPRRFHSRCARSSHTDTPPAQADGPCLQPFTCPLHPCPCDRSSINMRLVPQILRQHFERLFVADSSLTDTFYCRWSPRAVKWALAFDPASSHHLLFGSRGLVMMHQGWNTVCSICMLGESAGAPLLRCKAGLPPLDHILLKR
jgi:hypothetical protein